MFVRRADTCHCQSTQFDCKFFHIKLLDIYLCSWLLGAEYITTCLAYGDLDDVVFRANVLIPYIPFIQFSEPLSVNDYLFEIAAASNATERSIITTLVYCVYLIVG